MLEATNVERAFQTILAEIHRIISDMTMKDSVWAEVDSHTPLQAFFLSRRFLSFRRSCQATFPFFQPFLSGSVSCHAAFPSGSGQRSRKQAVLVRWQLNSS